MGFEPMISRMPVRLWRKNLALAAASQTTRLDSRKTLVDARRGRTRRNLFLVISCTAYGIRTHDFQDENLALAAASQTRRTRRNLFLVISCTAYGIRTHDFQDENLALAAASQTRRTRRNLFLVISCTAYGIRTHDFQDENLAS
jgi:CDP-diacylglycerol pyrophosphatase